MCVCASLERYAAGMVGTAHLHSEMMRMPEQRFDLANSEHPCSVVAETVQLCIRKSPEKAGIAVQVADPPFEVTEILTFYKMVRQ